METNKIITDYLNLIDNGLNKKLNPWKLVIQLEDFVDEKMYLFLEKNNPQLLSLMADDIYDITEPMEPEADPADFFSHLVEFKQKIIEVVK